MKRAIIPILCFSHVDFTAAVRWLRWASFLASQANGDMSKIALIVFGQQQTTKAQWNELKKAVIKSDGLFDIVWEKNPDAKDYAYPMGANHGFLRSLQYVKANHPKSAALFIEPDCVPVRPTWFAEIVAEYSSHDKCFSGQQVPSATPHMTGNAIYGAEWPRRAPSILTVMDRQNSGGMFAQGNGYPFDLAIGAEVLADFHHSKRIHQVWRPGYWTKEAFDRVPKEAALVHQSKDASLISVVARESYPGFIPELEADAPRRYFLLEGSGSTALHGKQAIAFKECARSSSIRLSVKVAEHGVEEQVLLGLCGKHGISEITKEDYDTLIEQSKKKR
jgi:hypothetical protein